MLRKWRDDTKLYLHCIVKYASLYISLIFSTPIWISLDMHEREWIQKDWVFQNSEFLTDLGKRLRWDKLLGHLILIWVYIIGRISIDFGCGLSKISIIMWWLQSNAKLRMGYRTELDKLVSYCWLFEALRYMNKISLKIYIVFYIVKCATSYIYLISPLPKGFPQIGVIGKYRGIGFSKILINERGLCVIKGRNKGMKW